jgi:hypothetical protein
MKKGFYSWTLEKYWLKIWEICLQCLLLPALRFLCLEFALKGQCRKIFLSFFIKQLFMTPIDTPWKEFQLFSNTRGVNRIHKWLLSVFTSRESILLRELTIKQSLSRGSRLPTDEYIGCLSRKKPKLVNKYTCWCQVHQGVKAPGA